MIKWNGRTVLTIEPDQTIESDASTQGWGASHQSTNTGGPWSPLEKEWHSGDSSIENICQTQNRDISVNEDRKHNSRCLYQQPRWDSIQ